MKSKIRASIEAKKAQIIEEIEDGNFYAIHYSFPGESRWVDGIHGYAAVRGEQVVGRATSDGKASTMNRPETITEFVAKIEGGRGND